MRREHLFLGVVAASLANCAELGPVGFNVYTDIYARPQFGVSVRGDGLAENKPESIYDNYILREDALEVLKFQKEAEATGTNYFWSPNGARHLAIQAEGTDNVNKEQHFFGNEAQFENHIASPMEYKFMTLHGNEYFCEIPRVPLSRSIELKTTHNTGSANDKDSNSKSIDASTVEQIGESDGHDETDVHYPNSENNDDSSTPASDIVATTNEELTPLISPSSLESSKSRALELLQPLSDGCLYYNAGYWTYSICYGHEITQFHAAPQLSRDKPPEPEKGVPSYVLGKFENGLTTVDRITTIKRSDDGGAYYASQLLGNGTDCDLIDGPRSIEVQYLCNPKTIIDTIVLIKEVRTCYYRMVINTKRLCSDLVFVPPKDPGVNEIKCRRVVNSENELTKLLMASDEQSDQDQTNSNSELLQTSADDIFRLSGGLKYTDARTLLDIDPPIYPVQPAEPEEPALLYPAPGVDIMIPYSLPVDTTGTPIMEEYASTLEFIRDGLLNDIGNGFYSYGGVAISGSGDFHADNIHVLDIDGRLIAKATITVSNGIGQVLITVDDEIDQSSKSVTHDPDGGILTEETKASFETDKSQKLSDDGDEYFESESYASSASSSSEHSSPDPDAQHDTANVA
ncbi:Yos9p [Sugiyamaella lignohabitans]|uniref:Endoplasmic reticulum lectin n=1 Tax=Sugiyamaella lignohabitans TaxID=796027 RepID=A0A167FB97_9ASCO|nr:Yos9p [Sugiyamaella lignohabitans]ANB15062.1 Yos9p [Sugiyamaella lignohabitans]